MREVLPLVLLLLFFSCKEIEKEAAENSIINFEFLSWVRRSFESRAADSKEYESKESEWKNAVQ